MPTIPNIFHFVFGLKPQTEPFHLAYYLSIASCIAVNKPDRVCFHYKYLPYGHWWKMIEPQLYLHPVDDDPFVSAFNYNNPQIEKYRYAHSSDMIRLRILIKYGGIYADIDTLFVNPLPKHFFEKRCIMGMEKVDYQQMTDEKMTGSLCNAWIAAEKGAEFCKIWLEEIYKAFDGSWSAHSTFLPFLLSKQYPELIHVEPERSFFHFSWAPNGIAEIFSYPAPDLKNVYSIHLWGHLWWDSKRIDFSPFNYQRLTLSYVCFANTTYAYIARRFLPPGVKASPFRYWLEKVSLKMAMMKVSLKRKIKWPH